ncbi:MAG: hypothetical protein WC282_04815, partial [Bacilli bacterium]
EKTTTTQMNSLAVDVTADFEYLGTNYDSELTVLGETHIDANAEVNLKINNMFEDNAVGIIEASADVLYEEDGEALLDATGNAAVYLSEGWVYADLTEAAPFIVAMGQTAPEILTIKKQVGNLATALEIDPEQPVTLPFDMATILPYMNEIENVDATLADGNLTVVYTISLDDVADVYMKVMIDQGEIDPSQLTSEQLDTLRDQILLQLDTIIDLTEAKLTIGVNSDGFINKLYVDIDAALSIPSEGGHSVHDIDGSFHVDISNINGTNTITLPNNLDTYTEIPDETE